jgi:hypothetical protein
MPVRRLPGSASRPRNGAGRGAESPEVSREQLGHCLDTCRLDCMRVQRVPRVEQERAARAKDPPCWTTQALHTDVGGLLFDQVVRMLAMASTLSELIKTAS